MTMLQVLYHIVYSGNALYSLYLQDTTKALSNKEEEPYSLLKEF